MKQMYALGIVVVILLIVLFGISKLTSPSSQTATTSEGYATTSFTQPSSAATSSATMNTPTSSQTTEVVLHTNKGDITLEIFTGQAPITTGNFLKLAKSGFYDGVKFHRVIDGFMIQGGDPLTKDDAQAARWGTGGPGYTIQDEFAQGLSNVRGTISMANAGPNTGGSQFFINTTDNVFLDGKHAVFGRVTAGMEVVDAISKVKTAAADRPVEAVVIKSVEVKE
jgi:cyclophilin family peptidyl-prolyl cis-trans isomerase